MTKNEFFTSLNNKLSILNEKERKDITDEYVSHVDLKICDGKTEEQAVADFGDIDDLARDILEAYHIDNTAAQTKTLEYYVKSGVNFINQATESLLNFSPSAIARIIVEFFLVILVIIIISWPISMLSSSIRHYMSAPFLSSIAAILIAVIELVKISIGFLITYSFIKTRIISKGTKMNNKNENFDWQNNQAKSNGFAAQDTAPENHPTQDDDTTTNNAQAYSNSKKQFDFKKSAEYQEQKHFNGGDFIITLVVNVLKITLFLVAWIPAAIITVIGIVCTVLACIIFATKGIGFLGICIIGIGCSLMGISFTAWLGEVIFGGKKNNA